MGGRAMSVVTLTAIHGNGGGAHRFALAAPHFPADVDFRPLTLPGFADRRADAALRTLADYGRYLSEVIARQPRPRVLLGHGIGGSLALQMAQHYAPMLDGLILHAPVGAFLNARWFPRLMALPGARRAGQLAISSPLLRPLWRKALFTKPVPPAFADRFFEEYRQCANFSQMFDLITASWFDSLSPVQMPSALLWGARERVLAAGHAPAFQALLPGAKLRIIDHWDHFPMIDQPEEYAQVVTVLVTECLRRG
jgi:pimeloyl-ACP methyl ester carboxylesterase